MVGAWNHAHGRATVLVERLARLRGEHLAASRVLVGVQTQLAPVLGRLTMEAAGAGTNDTARRGALDTLKATDPEYVALAAEDRLLRDQMADLDAEIAADHERLMLVRAELAWLTASAGQQREEGG